MFDHLVIVLNSAIFALALFAGIGPQNLNIISHAIGRHYSKEVTSVSLISDIVLILIGCIWLGISNSHSLIFLINVIGIVFICWYLYHKIKSLLRKKSSLMVDRCIESRHRAIVRALALTWLNPLVIIDTIVIIGGTSTHYSSALGKIEFTGGVILGDIIWLLGLTFIASKFSRILNNTVVWFLLDLLTIAIMSVILYKTVLFVIK